MHDEPRDPLSAHHSDDRGRHDLPARDPDDDLPVVARLVIEVRSDGTRTVARGAMEDLESGQKVGIEARGGSPLELSASLTRAILQTPALAARMALRSLAPGRVPARLRRLRDRLLGGK